MAVIASFRGVVERVEEGKLRGQRIAHMRTEEGEIVFDVIEGIADFVEGETLELELHEEKPSSLDEYAFCGHGFLAKPENEAGRTVLSVWGILFVFPRQIGLVDGKKYYVCIRRLQG